MTLWHIFGFLFGIGGISVLIAVIRGNKIDDHPICRVCGFDLFGRPKDSQVCSECGQDLRSPDAIRIGHRRAPRWALLTVLPLAFLSLLSFAAGRWWERVDVLRYKPDFLLMSELNSPTTRFFASVELANRLASGQLSREKADAITERALRAQADPKIAWDGSREGWLEHAQENHNISQQQWDRYALGCLKFNLVVRPTVGRGDPVPIRISWDPTGRGRCFGPISFVAQADFGQNVSIVLKHTGDPTEFDPGKETFVIRDPRLAQLPAGPQALTLTLNLSMPQCYTRGRMTNPVESTSANPTVTLKGKWVLSPQPEVPDATTDSQIEPIECESIDVAAIKTPKVSKTSRSFYQVETWTVTASQPARNLACHAFIDRGGKEVALGEFVAAAGQNTSAQFEIAPGLPDGKKATLILRPSAEVAAAQITPFREIWGKAIVVRNVAIHDAYFALFEQPVPHPSALRQEKIENLMAHVTDHLDPVLRRSAAAELAKRIAVGRCTSDETQSLVRWALKYQGDRSRPWFIEIGNILDNAQEAGQLSDDERKQYAIQSVGFALQVPGQIRPGEAIELQSVGLPVRHGENAKFVYRYADAAILLSKRSIRQGAGAGSMLVLISNCHNSGSLLTGAGYSEFAGSTGPQTLTWLIELSFWEWTGDTSPEKHGALIATSVCRAEAKLDVLAH